MKGISGWDFKPYTRLNENDKKVLPYICRVAPTDNEIEIEWFDKGSDGGHILRYKKRNSDEKEKEILLHSSTGYISNCDCGEEYEFYVARQNDMLKRSDKRIAHTGSVPGTVVNYLHPEDTAYIFSGRSLCSPSIVKLKSGKLLASMDVYAAGYPQNLTLIYQSFDNSRSWNYLTDLFPCFWGKLFIHRDRLYMLAVSTEYGDLLIGASVDEGKTWCAPVRILPGSGGKTGQEGRMESGVHKAPMPVINYSGRLFTAVDYGCWSLGGHSSALLSIEESADLMNPENWSCTEFLPYNNKWEGAVEGKSGGALEGNAVVSPEGDLCNFLRYNIGECNPSHSKAIILKADPNDFERPLEFHRIVDFNGGSNSKYDILQDEKTGKYLSIVNEVVDDSTPGQRNVLSFAVSDDMYNWQIAKRLLDYSYMSPDTVGFQYVSFIIDNDDILYLSRTAFNGARNFHDANYCTFHTIKEFRQYY